MKTIQIQGLIFSLIAILTGIGSWLSGPVDSTARLIIIAGLIFFLGVPHGALDPVFAQKILHVDNWKSWCKFIATYLVLMVGVVGIWWKFPLFFISIFLILSVLHFSRDLNFTTAKIIRILYGGSMIVLPALLHFNEMKQLFTLLLNDNVALEIVNFLHVIAWPWLIAIIMSIFYESVKNLFVSLEIFSLTLLTIFAQPLIGFTVYFCAMHSLRHILRTQAYADLRFNRLALISIAPMMGVSFLVLIGWFYLPDNPDYQRIIRFVFVTLAALTIPHMLLIDRAKYKY